MPEHQDLDIFRRTRAGQEDKPPERLTGEQVDQPYHHAPHVAPEQPAATRALANSNQQVNLGDILSGTHKADGLRAADGYAIDAKYVKDPDSCKTPRTLEKLQLPDDAKNPWETGPHEVDQQEVQDYGRAIKADGSKVRGLEIITNGPETMAYWQYLMAKEGVPCSVRYHPAHNN
ncbi:restriction endonuclease fold toxin-2 domain-containing protein [Streptomyces sparsogenes]|uniref:restriction endonuclease fold toxin-2 domain-containing protein n=1 Tax=Streptomyces sparsogenes TaxID=67365 RepID=UPI003410FC16